MRLPKASGRTVAALALYTCLAGLAVAAAALVLAMIPLAILLVAIPILAALLILGTVILCAPLILLAVFLARQSSRPATPEGRPCDADSCSPTPGPTCP